MPSPFPGMDPFLESQEWEDFHSAAINVIRDLLTPELVPAYVARIERRVYVETEPGEPDSYRVADVAVVAEGPNARRAADVSASSAATLTPVECIMHIATERREAYLEIRDRESSEVVTVIELLSPTNKRGGGDGRAEYRAKRKKILASATHLVEIDLLRGGLPLPTESGLPAGDYFVLVSRSHRRPRVEVYAWPLEHRLPKIPIPLREGDGDVVLDLQAVLDTVYDRARYDVSLDYDAEVVPPLDDAHQRWATELISSRRGQ